MPTPAFSVRSPDRAAHAEGLIELCSRNYRGALSIGGDGTAARLVLGKRRVAVTRPRPSASSVRLGPRVAQLLIGTADPLEICRAAGARPRGDAARLLRVLFPAQHPQLQRGDRF